MKYIFVIAASLLAGTAGAQQAITAGGVSSGTIAMGARTCTVTFKGGDITTSGCDFSLPLRNPKFFPESTDRVRIEFDQTVGYSSGSTVLQVR